MKNVSEEGETSESPDGFSKSLRCVAYNPLTLQPHGRTEEVLTTLNAHVTVLTGTKMKLSNVNKGDKYRLIRIGVYDVYEFGWSKGRFTNKSAGVSVALDRRVFPRSCIRVFPPPGDLQGRGAFIRIKGYIDHRIIFASVCGRR